MEKHRPAVQAALRKSYLNIVLLSILSLSWVFFIYQYQTLGHKERSQIDPYRLSHGSGIPTRRKIDVKCPNQLRPKYGPNRAGEFNDTKCLKKFLFYGRINEMFEYPEMALILNIFKENIGYVNTAFIRCPAVKCVVELRVGTDRDYFDQTDVVIFGMLPKTFGLELDKLSLIKPSPNQTWIFYSAETPYRVLRWIKHLQLLDVRYHKLMTYHMGSDIQRPFGYYVKTIPTKPSNYISLPNVAANKTHLIVWMVSNCRDVFWARPEYVQELMNHVHIDVYGRCGSLTCLPRDSEECMSMLSKYKFYLALANSECRHYITEKFWRTALQHNIVPIVYGAPKADFDKFAPPNSYIHLSDFASPGDLANYLRILDKNDTLYNSFFEWKRKGYVKSNFPPDPSLFCDILTNLNNSRTPHRKKLKLLKTSLW